jgi:hypothetical protein
LFSLKQGLRRNAALALALATVLFVAATHAAYPLTPTLQGLWFKAQTFGQTVRRHHRRHYRRWHKPPEEGAPRQKPDSPPPPVPAIETLPPLPPPQRGKLAANPPDEKPALGKRQEPPPPLAGPKEPPPPEIWTPAEIKAAREDCDRHLAGLQISYDRLGPIREGVCGAPAPIKLKSLEGSGGGPAVFISPAPVVSCKLAAAVKRWLDEWVQPNAKTLLHASIVNMTQISSYRCLTGVDNLTLRVSEHALANALDISEFVTARGEHISILDDWNSPGEHSEFLHAIHDGACKIFGTTLGPEANSDHRNHFHLDMRERRHRPLCDFTSEQARARAKAEAERQAATKEPETDTLAGAGGKGKGGTAAEGSRPTAR